MPLAGSGHRLYCDRMTEALPTLFIFPHAGGSAQFYVPFAKAFSADVKRVAVQYPGRNGTHDVAGFTGIPDLADQVYAMIGTPDRSPGPVALFGHSMGGLVAFEVARRFEADSNPVAALFISACAAPGRVGFDYIPEHDRGLLDAVAQMTGVNRDFLDHEEFAARILPTVRGLRAITDYECPPDATVSCPIFAFFGDDDEVATAEKVQPWSQRTTADFGAREFDGHHFYLTEHVAALAEDIESKLGALCRL